MNGLSNVLRIHANLTISTRALSGTALRCVPSIHLRQTVRDMIVDTAVLACPPGPAGGEARAGIEWRLTVMGIPASTVLACPKCGKRYLVDPELVGRGKRVRCRVCSAVFAACVESEPRSLVDEDRIVAWLQQSPADE